MKLGKKLTSNPMEKCYKLHLLQECTAAPNHSIRPETRHADKIEAELDKRLGSTLEFKIDHPSILHTLRLILLKKGSLISLHQLLNHN